MHIDQNEDEPSRSSPGDSGFARKVVIAVLITAAVVLLFLLVHGWAHLLLVLFGAVLATVFIRGLSAHLSRVAKLPMAVSLVLVIMALGALSYVGGLYLAPSISEQMSELTHRLPSAVQRLREQVQSTSIGSDLIGRIPHVGSLLTNQRVLHELRGIFSITLGAFADLFIFVFVSLYLVFDPKAYIDGFLRLVHPHKRERASAIIESVSATLKKWLLGRLLSMALTGVITGIGLWLLGIPLALALGLLAGLLTFIPYIGAVISAVPAVLFAFVMRPVLAVSVVFLYLFAHTLEGYVLTPIVLQRQVRLPPVLTLISQVLLGSVAGFLGVMLASPLVAVFVVLVKMLYVEDVLGEKEAAVRAK